MARNSVIAVILLVALRLGIGWQLLYEGVWKLDTQNTAKPWTSAGYLKNAQGPMRDAFRSIVGDPEDLDWLNYDVVAARWDDWANRFGAHYDLKKDQLNNLDRLLNGRPRYASDPLPLPAHIEDLNDDSRVKREHVWYDDKEKRLFVDGKRHLVPRERDRLLKLIEGRDDPKVNQRDSQEFREAAAFRKEVDRVYKRQKRGMGYKEKLAGMIKGNPDLLGTELKPYADSQRIGQKEQYHVQLVRYEKLRAAAEADFQWDHLAYDRKKLESLRAEITGPVKSLEKEFQSRAFELLTLAQLSEQPETSSNTTLRLVDLTTMWGLTILGVLLISGLFTRLAAVAAAGLLFSFYLAMPPLPGLPEIPGPEHSYIVNKNLIEVIALLAIAAMPTGRWFGLDAWLAASRERSAAKNATT